jgi:hypothetical protein
MAPSGVTPPELGAVEQRERVPIPDERIELHSLNGVSGSDGSASGDEEVCASGRTPRLRGGGWGE